MFEVLRVDGVKLSLWSRIINLSALDGLSTVPQED